MALEGPVNWDTVIIIGTVASASAAAGFAVSRQISNLGDRFLQALADHKKEDEEKFNDHFTRIFRLELRAFGWSHNGKNPDRMDSLENSKNQ